MGKWFFRIIGVAIWLVGFLPALAKFTMDWTGRTTFLEDFTALQEKVRPILAFLDRQPDLWFYATAAAICTVGTALVFAPNIQRSLLLHTAIGRRRAAIDASLIANPEHVKRSSAYIVAKALFDREHGSLSPGNKIVQGSEQLHSLYKTAYETQDYETYLLVGHHAEWLLENARFFWGSSTGYVRALEFANQRTMSLHDRMRGKPTKQVEYNALKVTGTCAAYLGYTDEEIGNAIQSMARYSAWGKWFAAQHLANNRHEPIIELALLQITASVVLSAAVDGKLDVRGRPKTEANYQRIPREIWRLAAFSVQPDPAAIWRVVVIPRHNVDSERINTLLDFDSLIVSGEQFEGLWPRSDDEIDAKRHLLLAQALQRGADRKEVDRLSQD